jgi:hypothetical protein
MGTRPPLKSGIREKALFSCILPVTALILVCGCTGTVTGPVAVTPADEQGFEMMTGGPHFTVFYHTGDEMDAEAILAFLEREGVPLYKKYLGIEPSGIRVYLSTDPEEYSTVSGYPGGKRTVSEGAVSVYYGRIYLFMPARSTLACRYNNPLQSPRAGSSPPLFRPWPGSRACLNTRGLIWGGAGASISQYLEDDERCLPRFLREGIGRYVEYAFLSGQAARPRNRSADTLSSIYALQPGGTPALMNSDQLERRCSGYTNDEHLENLCREVAVYAVSYISERYGQQTMISFLPELKKTHDWKTALRQVTGQDSGTLWRDIAGSLNTALRLKTNTGA